MTGPDHLPIPGDFRWDDTIAFHARQAQGLTIRSDAARWSVALDPGVGTVVASFPVVAPGDRASVAWSGAAMGPSARRAARAMLHRMLGLDQDPGPWCRHAAGLPAFAGLAARRPGLRVPGLPGLWEAAVWAVIGQQVSRTAASRILHRVLACTDGTTVDGLRPFPGPAALAAADPARLRAAGLSAMKLRALVALAGRFQVAGRAAPGPDLLAGVPGIGPWTIHYAVMRGLGDPDRVPLGDAVIHAEVGRRLGRSRPASRTEVEAFTAPAAPWRSFASAHLWAGTGDPVP